MNTRDLKKFVKNMTIVDDTLAKFNLPARYHGDSVTIKMADLAKLIKKLEK